MYRSRTQRTISFSTVQADQPGAFQLLLFARENRRAGAEADAARGRDLHDESVLRFAPHHGGAAEGRALHQPQAHSKDHAEIGTGGDLAGPAHVPATSRTPEVSLSLARACHPQAHAGVELGYHLHPIAWGIRISSGGDRLVQSASAISSTLKQPGEHLLPGGLRGRDRALRPARNFQYRSRSPCSLARRS
jgi:hypothetical protein